MKPTIDVELKILYGKRVYYPVCQNAIVFCNIAGTKTLTEDLLKQVNKLGFQVNIQFFVPKIEEQIT